ncbi:MAG: MurR/RpiR family transcriptional regulator [Alphaproteobacteria bacterium]|nr:MurR/RpiR family transcriptional regulator [Alphaproteobacteria bacterium]
MSYQAVNRELEAIYSTLSPQLRRAARYVLDRPDDVALYTMRRLAARAGVHPTTMVRLARRLDYPGFDALRDIYRDRLSGIHARYSHQARDLQTQQSRKILEDIAKTEIENVADSFGEARGADLERCARLLDSARRIYLVGLRGCFPIAFYLHYSLSMFRDDVVLIDGVGGTLADGLRDIEGSDVLVAISFSPYTRETVNVVNYAAARRARIIAITDGRLSPLNGPSTETLLVRCDSPSFFQSISAAQSVVQALVALVIAGGGDKALNKLAQRERQLASFDAYWDDVPSRIGAQ